MEEGVRHIEMSWRCSTCEHRNLGRHKNCQGCGNPKDGSEQYEMPENPEQAASVTDADLLRMATAGPDWRCAYCGSDQRRADNSCGQCGAAVATGTELPDEPAPPRQSWFARREKWITRIAIAAALLVVVIVVLVWNAMRPRDYDGKVQTVAWEHTIDVEKYAIRKHEGFKENIPGGAMEVTSLGKRVHHHEQVPDGFRTEHYTVQVPDGYRTETYTAQESCGQDCTTSPRSCSQKCTSKKNGFASCSTSCTGGTRSCRTKYCSRTKTRQVAKTRSEGRTRQVPKFRSEPRYAEAFSWRVWEWAHERTVSERGTDVAHLKWPAGAQKLTGGEQEREKRKSKYVVTLLYGDDTLKFEVTDTVRLASFANGSDHAIHKEQDVWSVDGVPVTPLE